MRLILLLSLCLAVLPLSAQSVMDNNSTMMDDCAHCEHMSGQHEGPGCSKQDCGSVVCSCGISTFIFETDIASSEFKQVTVLFGAQRRIPFSSFIPPGLYRPPII